jgi:hypothetical protein
VNVNLKSVRDVNTGFGDGLAAAFEMLAGPAIFGFLGHLLDQKLGIGPVFLLTFSITVFAYQCWKLFNRYNAEMDKHLADLQLARRGPNPRAAEDVRGHAGPGEAGPAATTAVEVDRP